jgi:Histidine kinase
MVSPALPAAPPAPTPALRAWDMPARIVLPGALLVSLLISTQYLFQPFVWRNWPVDEVLLGWVDIVRERVVTALAIGVALVLAGHVPVRSALLRAVLMVVAITLGAAVGELTPLLLADDSNEYDIQRALGHVLRWTVVGSSIAAMAYLWRRSADTGAAAQAAELRRAQTERQLAQTNLQVLRSRIEPHFLFNTLANVRRLYETDPVAGEAMLERMTRYLKVALPSLRNDRSTLAREAELIESYLELQHVRMGRRLAYRIDVAPALRQIEVPPLMLLTLVENAIKHGLAPQREGGRIEVGARLDGATLVLEVADTGRGFGGHSAGGGTGLANLRARLAAMFGAAAEFSLAAGDPRGLRATIRMPAAMPAAA